MKETNYTLNSNEKPFTRYEIVALMANANKVGNYRFARKTASFWLKSYPGDLEIETLHAKSLLNDDRIDLATPILLRLCKLDPEYLPVQLLLASIGDDTLSDAVQTAKTSIVALGGKADSKNHILDWGNQLLSAKNEEKQGNISNAEKVIKQIFQYEITSPLPAILYLKLVLKIFGWKDIHNLANDFYERWPECLVFSLILADTIIKGGQEERAVNLLHQAVSKDISGQVPERLWGKDHKYNNLWLKNPQITLTFPIPADVAKEMGWNQLPAGKISLRKSSTHGQQTTHQPQKTIKDNSKILPTSNQHINSIKSEFEKIAKNINKPDIAFSDGRFPAYIVLTTHEGLESQYGENNLIDIHHALHNVVKTTQNLTHWDAHLVYADDAESTDKFGIPPAEAKDPWSIKNLISDLDKALSRQGEMIGALLIVGGPKVIPFHHLPNPVDDFDTDVPSDNPYASNDENYFIPSWPVGRLPGSADNNPQVLIDQLLSIAEHRHKDIENTPFLERITSFFLKILRRRKNKLSFGYSAEIWRRAANSVFRPIGKPHTLVISPPTEANHIEKRQDKGMSLAYFNLHGLEEDPYWFGQRDPIETDHGPDFPIALRPQDIVNSGRAPQIVFSESCFGANIFNKSVDDAICLKFLASGTKAIVGSTCTSYGSIATPLIAADLLGKAFWKFLQDGYTAGESLRRAKIHLANEMHKRQGYLDGEDQKTLISFILYGDPLATSHRHPNKTKKSLRVPTAASEIKTVCDKANPNQTPEIPDQVLHQVKNIVRNYLPGMTGAKILYSQEHTKCEGDNCPVPHGEIASIHHNQQGCNVITLSKQIVQNKKIHPRHARITLNQKGKVIKLAVSR